MRTRPRTHHRLFDLIGFNVHALNLSQAANIAKDNLISTNIKVLSEMCITTPRSSWRAPYRSQQDLKKDVATSTEARATFDVATLPRSELSVCLEHERHCDRHTLEGVYTHNERQRCISHAGIDCD